MTDETASVQGEGGRMPEKVQSRPQDLVPGDCFWVRSGRYARHRVEVVEVRSGPYGTYNVEVRLLGNVEVQVDYADTIAVERKVSHVG